MSNVAKYHVNLDGKIGECKATKLPCRFKHFSTAEEAIKIIGELLNPTITSAMNAAKLAKYRQTIITNMFGNAGERMELPAALQLLLKGKLDDGTVIGVVGIGGKRITPKELRAVITEEDISAMVQEFKDGEIPPATALRIYEKLGLEFGKIKASSGSKADICLETTDGVTVGFSVKATGAQPATIINSSQATVTESILTPPSNISKKEAEKQFADVDGHKPPDAMHELKEKGWTVGETKVIDERFKEVLFGIDSNAPAIWAKIAASHAYNGRGKSPSDFLSKDEARVFNEKILLGFATKYNPTGIVADELQAHALLKINADATIQAYDLSKPKAAAEILKLVVTEQAPSKRTGYTRDTDSGKEEFKGGVFRNSNGDFAFRNNMSIRSA